MSDQPRQEPITEEIEPPSSLQKAHLVRGVSSAVLADSELSFEAAPSAIGVGSSRSSRSAPSVARESVYRSDSPTLQQAVSYGAAGPFADLSTEQGENSVDVPPDNQIVRKPDYLSFHERYPVLTQWETVVVDVNTSEPRDLLQCERTVLGWIKLSVTLGLVSAAFLLDFRINDATPGGDDGRLTWLRSKTFVRISAAWFTVLALLGIISGGLNYFFTLNNYAARTIKVSYNWMVFPTFLLLVVSIVTYNVFILVRQY